MSETPFDVERLAEHAGFVRALARSLLRGERGDDVAQEALTVALSRPPLHDQGPRGLRGWLATVTRRLARDEQRGAQRRESREQAGARREPLDSAADVAVRMESMRRLLAALAELPEPDRVVIVMRFYDALPPRRIASTLAIPVNTVRTRLQRALERLRANYLGPADRDGLQAKERDSRLAGLALLSGGAMVMGAKKVVAIGAVAAIAMLAAGVGAWRWSEPANERLASPSIATAATAEAPARSAGTSTEATRSATPDAAPTQTPDSKRWVRFRGRLRDRAGNTIRPEGAFVVYARYFQTTSSGRDAGLQLEGASASIAADGTVESRIPATSSGEGVDNGELARIEVTLAPRGFLAVSRTIPIPDASAWPKQGDLEVDCEIVALKATTITGRVVDEAGKPVSDMVAALFRRVGAELVLVPGSECITWHKEFRIAAVDAGTYELVVTPPRFDTYAPETAWVQSTWELGDDFEMRSTKASVPTLRAPFRMTV